LENGGGPPPLFSPPLFTHALIHSLSHIALSDGSIYCVVVMKQKHHSPHLLSFTVSFAFPFPLAFTFTFSLTFTLGF